ncbi:addiction module protein [Cyanobium sp. T1G-Tous]|uniref:addiction module protein n=1 Tax=Cyanobium sp. T1G-Tous TaxID=2823722 RepID=UPI0020CBE763|nr:addiction module protein [Cyanobium sp. T1G-Tous]MCP9804479.1 addiction module protein [Cyanobium sp. T1G-Tous]
MPLVQRLELVQTLWDSIAAEQIGPELTDVDQQLIDQRLESFLTDGDTGLDAEPRTHRSAAGLVCSTQEGG